jgi:hypothetical protein
MANLNTFRFTYQADRAYSSDGWILSINSIVRALAGDDDIHGDSSGNGFESAGTLYLGDGNDRLTGSSLKLAEWANRTIGLHISGAASRLYAGNGHDSIIGMGGYYGLVNYGILDTGTGNDLISGTTTGATDYTQRSEGFTNYGSVDTNFDADTISVYGRGCGLNNIGNIATGNDPDQILATADEIFYGIAICNQESGSIHTGSHDDVVRALAADAGIWNDGFINMGSGNDFIEAVGNEHSGINNTGILYAGPGNDQIRAHAWRGLINSGVIDTDIGNDTIDVYFTASVDFGLLNDTQGRLSLGDGDDQVTLTGNEAQIGGIGNHGLFDFGRGHDRLLLDNVTGVGIRNTGTINMYEGNDQIISSSTAMILNDGDIFCGGGADIIDSIAQGFSGQGVIDMGTGNDTLRGIAIADVPGALYKGGSGVDTLAFKSGTYGVARLGLDAFLIDGKMRVMGFERFGSGAAFLSLAAAASQGSVTFA